MLIAEDLLLLLTDDKSGKHIVDKQGLDLALAGATLAELAERGKVALAGQGEAVKPGRFVTRDRSPTGSAVLDETLRRCASRQGAKPQSVLSTLTKDVRTTLLTGLAARGVLQPEEKRVLWIFRTTRWRAIDSHHEAQVRELVTAALVHGTTPAARTAALIALLSAVDATHKVVDFAAYGVDKKTIKSRAKAMRKGSWVADAVARAIQSAHASAGGG